MSRRRYITSLISIDKRVRRLTDSAALLYTWAIPHAEEDGTIDADPEELLSMVFPNRPGWTVAKMERCVREIEDLDLARVYEGRLYFPPGPFYSIQSNVHLDKRRNWHPERNARYSGETAENSGEQRRTAENSASPSPSPSPSKDMVGKPTLLPVDNFAEWWQLYPWKVGKPRAEQAYRRATKVADPAKIMAGLRSQLPRLRAQEEGFRLHPATWLNQQRWNDVMEVREDPERRRRINNAVECLEHDAPDQARAWVRDESEWQEVLEKTKVLV
jgi:hypothetical protein